MDHGNSMMADQHDRGYLEVHYCNAKELFEFGADALCISSSASDFDSHQSARRTITARHNYETDDFFAFLHGSDPVKVELNRLENEVRDKDRKLAEAQAEIKALKLTERSREKAFDELSEELRKVDEKLNGTEFLLENKNLELKRVSDEKKAAQAAQIAAEATLRRVHAAQKQEDGPPLEVILAPLEAELKLERQEIARLQEDNRALDRLTKSKEVALLEAEKTVQIAEAKASLVDDLQNRNQELMKQIELCQEENKILHKMHRQKVSEVEKLSSTIGELEEEVLASGAAANAIRDYERQIQKLEEEKKTLDRELARVKITANRVAVVVANEWKDPNSKVMPVRQWLEERRFMQGEMQQLRDKLAIMERSAKTEAYLKEKLQLRLKVLEEIMKTSPIRTSTACLPLTASGEECSPEGVDGYSASSCRRSSSVSRSRGSFAIAMLQRKGRVISRSFIDSRPLSETIMSNRSKVSSGGSSKENEKRSADLPEPTRTMIEAMRANELAGKDLQSTQMNIHDTVPGLLYDMLQKEVLNLKKTIHEKNQSLKDKENAIEMLEKKVENFNRTMEHETKRMRREVAGLEKEIATMRLEKEPPTQGKGKPLGSSSKGSANKFSRR